METRADGRTTQDEDTNTSIQGEPKRSTTRTINVLAYLLPASRLKATS